MADRKPTVTTSITIPKYKPYTLYIYCLNHHVLLYLIIIKNLLEIELFCLNPKQFHYNGKYTAQILTILTILTTLTIC